MSQAPERSLASWANISFGTLAAALVLFLNIQATLFAIEPDGREKYRTSGHWQVRYSISSEYKLGNPHARAALEELALDPHPAVARQAFAIYTNTFVDVSQKIADAAFARGDLDLVGGFGSDESVFRDSPFWIGELKKSGADRGRAARSLGLLGKRENAGELSGLDSDNPYVLLEIAVALRRLGDNQGYQATLEKIFLLPTETAIYYKTKAIDCLIQTHPDRAREYWNTVHSGVKTQEEMQPNWFYGHIIQEERLP